MVKFNTSIKITKSTPKFDMVLELKWLKGNSEPYFAITGTEYKVTKSGKRDKRYSPIGGGAIGDEWCKAHPSYSDFNEFHLRTINGAPNYAIENALYFFGYHNNGSKHNYDDGNLDNVKAICNHFLIDRQSAEKMFSALEPMADKERVDFVKRTVAELTPMWESKAIALLKKYFGIEETDFDVIKENFASYTIVR